MKNCPWFSLRSNSIASRCDFNEKQKQLGIRFARSRCIGLHKNVDFLGFKALKSGFSGSLGATFQCDARRHSLWIYRKHSNCTDTDKSEPYLFQHFA